MRKLSRKCISALLALAMLVSVLPIGTAPAQAAGAGESRDTEGYSIDYEEETITIAEGYSLYTAASGGNAIFTASSGNGTYTITSHIPSAG